MEFEKLRAMMPHVALNTAAAREHVGELEQKIRVINSLNAMDGHDRPLKN